MLGNIIASLDDPKVAMGVIEALDDPVLRKRLIQAAGLSGRQPAELVSSAVRNFMETASDNLWTQLMGVMNRADDPALSAIRTILEKALPPVSETEPPGRA